MHITTNTQDKFKVLHDDPLLRSDSVLGKITIVGQRKEVIYGLSHRFVNSEKLIMVEKSIQVAFREVG